MNLDPNDFDTVDLASPCLSKDLSSQGVDLELDPDGSVFVFDNKANTLFSIVNDKESISIASASIISMSMSEDASMVAESPKSVQQIQPRSKAQVKPHHGNMLWRMKNKMKKMKCVREDEEEVEGEYPSTSKTGFMKKTFKLPLLGFPLPSYKRNKQMDGSHSTVETISASETTYAASNMWNESSKDKPLSMSDTMYGSRVGHRTTLYAIGRTSTSYSNTALSTTVEVPDEEEKMEDIMNHEEEKTENTLLL